MFTTDYNTNLQIISDALRSEQSFDLVKRDPVSYTHLTLPTIA